jgi:hypothetical protein
LTLHHYDITASDEEQVKAFVDADSAAVAIFIIQTGAIQQDLFKYTDGPPWHLPAEQIPHLNKLLRKPVIIKHRRHGQTEAN